MDKNEGKDRLTEVLAIFLEELHYQKLHVRRWKECTRLDCTLARHTLAKVEVKLGAAYGVYSN